MTTPPNSSFVLVDIPLLALEEQSRGEAEYRYRIGNFIGRVVSWSMDESPSAVARLRIPIENFREDEELLVEVLAKGSHAVLWKKAWTMAWEGDTPALRPEVFDQASLEEETNERPRFYRKRR